MTESSDPIEGVDFKTLHERHRLLIEQKQQELDELKGQQRRHCLLFNRGHEFRRGICMYCGTKSNE